ncbi:hypothetical protein BEL04_00050 [Mucilaginibacter sp. PPCGB 2223]|uniref:hypothetical protein n=1 Tax=Mucilaginibacter sp. PPCGB 2223 TaxID=1886027 RepID=UPI000826E03E|nr:hypothetical protein [Mucilaginibacter sp. PPCGB 2223]OCX52766.1 hypothetical protein BEL04_00050 [Mucilaginibacter sp. PPCGB 2223]
METKEKATATGANTNDKKGTVNTGNMRPNVTGKEKTNDNKNQSPAQTAQATPAPSAETKAGSPAPQPQATAQPAQAVAAPAPAAEPSKKELKTDLQEHKVRGLEDTVKLVETLGIKIAQKNKLSNTITNLDSFLIAQSDDKDDVAGDSKFGRCELTIADDGGEEFVTKNAFIISKVVDMVKQLCLEKLAEVEATIVIPQ